MGAGGFSWDMPLGMSFSAEGYYKTMSNVMEYREGASTSRSTRKESTPSRASAISP